MDKNLKKIKTKKGVKRNLATLIIGLLVIVIIVIAFIAARNYYKSLNVLSFRDYSLFQYVDGQKFEYEGEFYLTRENEITKLETKDIVIESNTFPIYYKDDENLTLFPVDMELVMFDDLYKTYRINHFSQIKIDAKKKFANVVYKEKESYIGECVIYDGSDLYFFAYPIKLTIDDKEYELSSGSFAIVRYRSRVDLYDREKDEYIIIEETKKDVVGSMGSNKINLSTDTIVTDKGNRLLIKNVSKLPLFER